MANLGGHPAAMLFLMATAKTHSRKESYVLEVTRIAGLLDGYGETRHIDADVSTISPSRIWKDSL